MLRRCIEPGCPGLTPATRCVVHARARDRARGSTAARGYGRNHQLMRAALKRTLPALCGYGCGTLLHPTGAWVAAHRVDGNPDAGYVAACVRCNERAKRGYSGSGGPRRA